MRTLTRLDLAVVAVYLVAIAVAGSWLTRRASRSVDSFLLGDRSLPWWLLGVSMAATNFSIDTPVAMTQLVARDGVAGVWFFWANGISALLATFLFARLWRRSAVVTDAEITEVRYGGRPAATLRLLKGIYFGLLFNAFILGWVFLAVIKVLRGVTSLPTPVVLAGATGLVLAYTLASGLYGVVVTDFVQYFVALGGSTLLAVFAVRRVGGLAHLREALAASHPGHLSLVPSLDAGIGPLSVFLTYVLVQWWAHKYADGGGKHIQRMLAARSEGHAFAGSLLYAMINYALQVWPWILTALAALVLFGNLPDPEAAYPRMMVEVLPAGLLGLVLVGLLGAFMSTVDTHLNLGASYLVNDLYRRFLVPRASDRHYVLVSRLAMVVLLAVSIALALRMDSVAGAWKFLLTFASGAGLVWILRWFWWRINAWSEIAAMVSSAVVATTVEVLRPGWLYSQKLGLTVALSTVVWLAVTWLTRPVGEQRLAEFLSRVRPGATGWRPVLARRPTPMRPYLGAALGQWALGLVALFGLDFALGGWLLGSPRLAAAAAASGLTALLLLAARLRASTRDRPEAAAAPAP